MLNTTKVRDWMSRPILSVKPDTPIDAAYQLMKDNRVRRLPVIKGGNLVGIITIGDIREALPSNASTLDKWEMQSLIAKLTVEQIMTTNVITVGLDASVADAAQKMLDHKIGGVPVINALGMPIGILTESDIFRLVIAQSKEDLALLKP